MVCIVAISGGDGADVAQMEAITSRRRVFTRRGRIGALRGNDEVGAMSSMRRRLASPLTLSRDEAEIMAIGLNPHGDTIMCALNVENDIKWR